MSRQWKYVIKRGIWLQDCVNAYDSPEKRIMSPFSYYRKASKQKALLGNQKYCILTIGWYYNLWIKPILRKIGAILLFCFGIILAWCELIPVFVLIFQQANIGFEGKYLSLFALIFELIRKIKFPYLFQVSDFKRVIIKKIVFISCFYITHIQYCIL